MTADLEPHVDTSNELLAEQVRFEYRTLPLALGATVIISLLLALFQWSVINPHSMVIWIALILLISAARMLVYLRFRRASPTPTAIHPWARRSSLGVLLSGLIWGSAGILLFPVDELIHQVMLVLVLGGMTSGAATTLAARWTSASTFLLLVMVPITIQFFRLDTDHALQMGLMISVYIVMMLITIRRGYLSVRETITRRFSQQEAESVIHYQAFFDTLTALPNRALLLDRLEQVLAHCHHHGRIGALFVINLDRFKTINDSLGHTLGDTLIKQVALRLATRLCAEDTLAHPSGDEFVVLLSDISGNAEQARNRAQDFSELLHDDLAEPFTLDGRQFHLTGSIGITLFPLGEESVEVVLREADIAMHRAKEHGGNGVSFFLPVMQQAADERLDMESHLREALGKGELFLHFQPQVDNRGQIKGCEALLRWDHPQRGLIAPDAFIALAESSDLILPIGEWVLHSACRRLYELEGLGHSLQISVNVCPRQFRQAGFVSQLEHTLTVTGANPALLELEITEGTVVEDVEDTIAKMAALRTIGVRFAIDDFGTGYSSLAYLKRLPIDKLKIDQSFVRDVVTDPSGAAIVEAIISMAGHLGLQVTAEGVESEAIAAKLRASGCGHFQGFHFSRPVDWERYRGLLASASLPIAS